MQIRGVLCGAVRQAFDDALAADMTTGLSKPALTWDGSVFRMAQLCTVTDLRASPAHGSSGTTPSRFMFSNRPRRAAEPGTALAAVTGPAGLSRLTRCTNSGA